MTGRQADAIEDVARDLHREAMRGLDNVCTSLSRIATSLEVEANLPDRVPKWVAWARRRAKAARKLQVALGDFLADRGP